ncbi:hypothetical protein [Neobacillus jeddahensis]|uniref:hypothetical protein n=1 Tax=Neobacillus jeddahensis TaxID=1461580 RepID=UPI00058BE750|nr:hypothetical protein [Neobacillus jeddahensis]
MRTLGEINQVYEEILHSSVNEPYKSTRLAALMTEMELTFNIPSLRNPSWEGKNRPVIALYRKISMSRTI